MAGMGLPAGERLAGGSFDWAGLGRAYLFFLYFSGVLHVLLQVFDATIFYGLRQAIIVSALWLIPLLIFPRQARTLSAAIGVLLWATSLVGLGYFCIYQQEFSQSVIFILFESNPAEAEEYFAQYFVWWMVPAALVYSAGAWWLWRRIRPLSTPRGKAWGLVLLIVAALFAYPQYKQLRQGRFSSEEASEVLQKRFEPAVPWQLVFGYTQYRAQLANMESLLEENKQLPPLGNLKDANAGLPATLVLVIGESTNRGHMSLYGYPRSTTPKLDAMRQDLAIFKQVVSPRPYTIEVLQQALTLADPENSDQQLTRRVSLMNLMKQAGYKTFWITNQQTMTKRNTMLTNFSQQTDEQFYLNHTRVQNSREYDENVFDPFAKVLADPAERKFIVVHLLGTHMKYEYRYPPQYEFFKDRQGLPEWAEPAQVEVINSYDNAVRYNDHVVSTLIERFSAAQAPGFLVYFADHGEDVYDSPGHNVLGRNEGRPTPPMYTIPFLVWTSPAWRARDRRDFATDLERPYSTAHFLHSWADLAGLSFDGYAPDKSLVNPKFVERPLLVGDPGNPKSMIDLRSSISPGASATPGH